MMPLGEKTTEEFVGRARRRVGLAALGAASALSIGVALGAPGDIDRGFGRDGRTTISAGGQEIAQELAVAPDGRIVIGGYTQRGHYDGLAIRLNADGSPDLGFDGDGASTVGGAGQQVMRSAAIAPDGRVVLAGYSEGGKDAAVYRLTDTGAPDTTFDGDGHRAIDAGGDESAYGVTVQPDGKTVAVGSAGTDATRPSGGSPRRVRPTPASAPGARASTTSAARPVSGRPSPSSPTGRSSSPGGRGRAAATTP